MKRKTTTKTYPLPQLAVRLVVEGPSSVPDIRPGSSSEAAALFRGLVPSKGADCFGALFRAEDGRLLGYMAVDGPPSKTIFGAVMAVAVAARPHDVVLCEYHPRRLEWDLDEALVSDCAARLGVTLWEYLAITSTEHDSIGWIRLNDADPKVGGQR